MTCEVVLIESVADAIDRAFRATSKETFAVGFAGASRTASATRLLVHSVEVPEPAAYRIRGEGHLSISPAYIAGIALRCLEMRSRPVFFHSHPGSRHPGFSQLDAATHERLMPSVLRQTEGPAGTVVWGSEGWSAEIWDDGGRRDALVRISGRRIQPFGRPRTGAVEPYARQAMAFGDSAQHVLGSLRVGVVGLGGNGSLVAQACGHLGIGQLTLIDDDVLETSNLSRVVGAGPDSVGKPKVEIAAQSLARAAPDARVCAVRGDVRDCAVALTLRDCDVLFGCTDSHSSRAVLNQVAYQYAIPLIDTGSLIRVGSAGVEAAFADVRVARPGVPCLLCREAIDPERATQEMLGETDRQAFEERGYIRGPGRERAAAVLPLNLMTAGLATLRLLDLVAPWTEWDDRVTFELRQLRVVERAGRSDPACAVCGSSGPIGRGDDVPLRCRGVST